MLWVGTAASTRKAARRSREEEAAKALRSGGSLNRKVRRSSRAAKSAALADFSLEADIELSVMQPNQTLASLSSRLFSRIDETLAELQSEWVLVQGDTTTVQVGAVSAFYRRIPVGHVEAGPRSHDMLAPFPEELNRRIAGLVADLHFAPTSGAAANLEREGVHEAQVVVTGNTGIDALLQIASEVRARPPSLPEAIARLLERPRRFVLITGHRRESFGKGLRNICEAISALAGNTTSPTPPRPREGALRPLRIRGSAPRVIRSLGDRPCRERRGSLMPKNRHPAAPGTPGSRPSEKKILCGIKQINLNKKNIALYPCPTRLDGVS